VQSGSMSKQPASCVDESANGRLENSMVVVGMSAVVLGCTKESGHIFHPRSAESSSDVHVIIEPGSGIRPSGPEDPLKLYNLP